MPRFFVTKDDISENTVYISGDDSRHIARSLRMAVGDRVTVSDGEGTDYECELIKIRDESTEAKIIFQSLSPHESSVKITLFMSYPKGDKLETVIQKAVELGAARIVPFESSRCIKRPKADKAQEKNARLMRIALEAAKQCGRALIPEVSLPVSFEEAVGMATECDIAVFCYEGDGTVSLKKILESEDSPKSIAIMVGCEGGFSPEEAAMAENRGMKMANLGPRILRCETAPDYALSSISYHFEL